MRQAKCNSHVLLGRSARIIVCLMLLVMPNAGISQELTNERSLLLDSHSDSSPAIGADGTIYFGTGEGNLRAINPSGRPKWLFKTGMEIKSSPAVGSDGTIYFGCRNRKFYALRDDGKKRWEFPTAAWIDSSPALATDGR